MVGPIHSTYFAGMLVFISPWGRSSQSSSVCVRVCAYVCVCVRARAGRRKGQWWSETLSLPAGILCIVTLDEIQVQFLLTEGYCLLRHYAGQAHLAGCVWLKSGRTHLTPAIPSVGTRGLPSIMHQKLHIRCFLAVPTDIHLKTYPNFLKTL